MTTAQAQVLTEWLRDLTAHVVDRRKCRLADGHIWVGRWMASVLQQYCEGATPAEAYAALDAKLKGWIMTQRPAETYQRARLEILNRIFAFSLSHQWGDGRVMGDMGDYAWVSDIRTPPQIGDLIVLKSAPVSKFYLGWLVATDSKDGWTRYLVQSIEDGTRCWLHNVGIDHFNRKTLAQNEHWRWSDRQYAFKDRWWKVCFKQKDAYLTLPTYPVFGDGFEVTLGTRKRQA